MQFFPPSQVSSLSRLTELAVHLPLSGEDVGGGGGGGTAALPCLAQVPALEKAAADRCWKTLCSKPCAPTAVKRARRYRPTPPRQSAIPQPVPPPPPPPLVQLEGHFVSVVGRRLTRLHRLRLQNCRGDVQEQALEGLSGG